MMRDERVLAEIGRFSRHVRAGDEQDLALARLHVEIVRNELLVGVHALHDRVPAFPDEQIGAVRYNGPAIALSEAIFASDTTHRAGRWPARLLGCGRTAPRSFPVCDEKLVFQGRAALLRAQDLAFHFLEFRSDKAFAIDKRLLADVVLGNESRLVLETSM